MLCNFVTLGMIVKQLKSKIRTDILYFPGSDNETVKLDEVISQFAPHKDRFLAGKPKLFLIQACRGGMFMSIYTTRHKVGFNVIVTGNA